MKKVLFILGSYFPNPSPNGICVQQVAEDLKEKGIEITILATKTRGLYENEVINGIKVYRVKGRWINRLLEWSDELQNKNINLSRYMKRIILLINRVKNFIYLPIWPLISPIFCYKFYKKAKYLHRISNFSAVVSVYTPIDALITGALLKKGNADINLMYYFLDNLSGGIPPRPFNSKWLKKRGYAWEKRLFNYANNIYIMESHKKHYVKSLFNPFAAKIIPVDIPLMREIKPGVQRVLDLDTEKVNLVYTGSLSKKVKNPKYLFDLYLKLNKKNRYKLHIFGGGDCDALIRHYKSYDDSIIAHGKVNVETIYSVLNEADILINIGSSIDTQIPSKIFEYISVGKPIISLYKTLQEPSIPYLSKYPLSLLIEEDQDKLNKNVQLVDAFISNNKGEIIRYEDIQSSFSRNTPSYLADKIISQID